MLLKVTVPFAQAQCACPLSAAAAHSHVTGLACVYDVPSPLLSSSNPLSSFKKQPDRKMPPPPKAECFETHFSRGIYPSILLLEKTVFCLSYPLFMLDSQPLCDSPCTDEGLGGQRGLAS